MKANLKRALLFVAAAFVAAGSIAISARKTEPPKPMSPLMAAPADSMLVVTVDLERLRSSPVLAPLVQEGRELPGVGKLEEVCGFDPVGSLREIAFAMPSGEGDDLGVIATGPIEAEAFLRCASHVIDRRGGKFVIETDGSFTLVRDWHGNQGGTIAVRNGGPVLLGEGELLKAMMRAAEGKAPNALSTPHPELRERAGEGAIVASLVIPNAMKEVVRAELGGEDVPALRVETAAATLSADPAFRIGVLANCDSPEPCAELAGSLREARDEKAGELGARLVGLGKLLSRLRIEAEEKSLVARLDLPAEEASELVDRLMALQALRRALPDLDDAPELPPTASEVVAPGR